ncbi:cell death-inducing p53-target protein 1-like [Sphaeramia orbicularis]|uniref:Cell death-inducing p53-target protein 1-like n=1 Tax=Sphaeramia orbicularis TaxID=375764 RepID=A0A672YKC8_9TELE|nr:cell death-inducing p53-target protein 1-like [Sphaeramia orbicularis]
MSADGAVEGASDGVKVFYVHTAIPDQNSPRGTNPPVYTSGGGNLGTSLGSGEVKHKFVSYDTELGFHPGMTTCPTCQQQVMTEVTFKAGRYAWLTLLLIFCLGLLMCLAPWLLMPMVLHKRFKDAYHTCPRCNRVLHVEKRQCCQ